MNGNTTTLISLDPAIFRIGSMIHKKPRRVALSISRSRHWA